MRRLELRHWLDRGLAVAANDWAIVRGLLWVGVFVVLGKLAGAAKEVAVAWRYGTGREVDAYLFVFNLVSWPISIWFSALLAALVPLLARLAAEPGAKLAQFRAELCGLTLLAGLALALLTWVALHLYLGTGWTGLPQATTVLASQIAWQLALLAPAGMLIALLSAWMLSDSSHSHTLMESVPAVSILLVVLSWPGQGVAALVVGTLAGFALHLLLLAAALRRRRVLRRPAWRMASPYWPVFWKGFGVVLVGQALMSATVLIDQFSALHLPEGSLATLGYANRILALVIGLGVTAVSRATLPVFSQTHATDPQAVRALAGKWGRLMLLAGLATTGLGWWLAPGAVGLLFERGAFTAEDTAIVAQVLRHGLLQLPFYFAGIVLFSLLSAQARYRSLAMVSAACLGIKVVANLLLAPIAGLLGIQWSTALMYAFFLAALQWLMLRRPRQVAPTHAAGV